LRRAASTTVATEAEQRKLPGIAGNGYKMKNSAGQRAVPTKTTRSSLYPLSPNGLASSTQANWAVRGEFNSIGRANFSELLAAQRVRRRVFGNLESGDAPKRGQKFNIYLLAPQRLATNREK
jgi:hypothetical protein